MNDHPPPITQVGGGVLIQGEQTLAALYRSVLALIQRRHRDGLSSHDLTELRTTLFRAHQAAMSADGHKAAPPPEPRPSCNCHDSEQLIDIAAAARLLGVGKRQTRRLAAADDSLLGVRCGSIWVLDRAAVMALAARRKAAK